MNDIEQQASEPPVFQPDEAMLEILNRQVEQPLTIDQFDGREDDTFTIIDGELSAPLTLVEVKRLKKYAGAPCQNPGSLLFRAEKTWSIPQRLYRLRSEGHEEIVVFLSPVFSGRNDDEHIYMESVLN